MNLQFFTKIADSRNDEKTTKWQKSRIVLDYHARAYALARNDDIAYMSLSY